MSRISLYLHPFRCTTSPVKCLKFSVINSSQSGLGAALMQNGHPIAYANRALTETESRYAQIEKEMPAIVFSLEKFGRRTIVHTDHKPLESIVKKPLHHAPKRLQRMMIRLQQCDLEIRYKREWSWRTHFSERIFLRVHKLSTLPPVVFRISTRETNCPFKIGLFSKEREW